MTDTPDSTGPARRLRVAWVGGPLPAETGHLTLLARSVDLLVIASPAPGRAADLPPVDGVAVRSMTTIGTKEAPLRWVYPALGRALNAHRPDVVHVVSEPWGLLTVRSAAWVRLHPGAVLVVHGCDRIWWHGGRLERLAKRVLARVALTSSGGFCAETSAVAALAVSAGLPASAPTAQIHTNPRDPADFRPPTAQERADSRERLGLPATGTGVTFVGRLVPEKAPLLLLDAWESLPEDVRGDAWLALAGNGPLEQEVADRARHLPGVHALGTLSFPDGIVDLSRAGQVVAVPSYTVPDWDDQSPRTVIEGLLSGALVVGSRSGGIPVMLGDAGILVAERDTEDLARGLRDALLQLRDPELEDRHRAHAVARGTQHYSTASVAAQLLALWERCVGVSR